LLSFLLFLPSGYAWYKEERRYAAEELIPLDKLVNGIKSARGQRFTFDAKFRLDYCREHLLCPAALWEVCNNGGGTCKANPRRRRRRQTCTVTISGCKTSPQYKKKSRQQIVDEIQSSEPGYVDVKFHVDRPEECFHSKFCGNPSFLDEANPVGGGSCTVKLFSQSFNIPAMDNQHACLLSMRTYQLPKGTEGFLTAQDIKTRTSMNKWAQFVFKVKQESDCEDMCDEDICPIGSYVGNCNPRIQDFPKNLFVCDLQVVCYDESRRRNLDSLPKNFLNPNRRQSLPSAVKNFVKSKTRKS